MSRLPQTPAAGLPPEGGVALIYAGGEARRAALAVEPGLHNVLGYERAFAADPLAQDFLDPASPNHALKQLSTALYLSLFAPYLHETPDEARVLDAGCGVGRFTVRFGQRFGRVLAFDACRAAVERAGRHVRAAGLTNVDLHWADLEWLSEAEVEPQDVVVAVEFLSYVSTPAAALRRLTARAKPGAWLFGSVEATPGALCAQPFSGPDEIQRVASGQPLLHPEDRFVRFFDRPTLSSLLAEAGWRVELLAGCHYFAEGPMWQAIDDARLADPAYVAQIAAAEEFCRREPGLRDLGRALAFAARRA